MSEWDKKSKKDEKTVAAEPQLPNANAEPESLRDAMRAMVQELLPATAALISNNQQPQQAQVLSPAQMAKRGTEVGLNSAECGTCRQKQTACKGTHRQVVVYPQRYPEFGNDFPGVTINGVKYRSSSPDEFISVPEVAAESILCDVERFVEGERRARHGTDHTKFNNTAAKRQAAEQLGLL